MKEGIKKKWLKALRSGEYAQGSGALCEFNSEGNPEYCCLGVLIEVSEGEDVWEESGAGGTVLLHDNMHGFPSNAFLESVGLGHALVDDLVRLNDNGSTFEELANIIEEQA